MKLPFFVLSLLLPLPLSAAPMKLVVLKAGGIPTSSVNEVSRTVEISAVDRSPDGKLPYWQRTPDGLVCLSPGKPGMFDECTITVKVLVHFKAGAYTLHVPLEASDSRYAIAKGTCPAGENRHQCFLPAGDEKLLRESSFLNEKEGLLAMADAIHSGSEYYDAEGKAINSILIYVDEASGKVLRWEAAFK